MISRFAPKSLTGRLALASAVLIILSVIMAGAGTAFTMHRFVRAQIDQRLDAQIATVSAALTFDGERLTVGRDVDAPPFDRARSGWTWTARFGDQTLRSLDILEPKGPPPRRDERRGGREPDDWHNGREITRSSEVTIDGRVVDLSATAPFRALAGPMVETLRPVATTMLVLGVCLTLAAIWQLRSALRPLARLRGDVEAVRSGRAGSVPEEQPKEFRPLTRELNQLIAQNAEGLARARGHVANLGHALNTPLASLALALSESADPEAAKNLDQVRRMQDRIRHHLARARSAALAGPVKLRLAIAPRIADIADALKKIHAERGIRFEAKVAPDLQVASESQDFDEMVGNLLDNAFKWARSEVTLAASRDAAFVRIAIDDDGAGLPADLATEALLRGRRLDETVPGTGFGLPIANELADYHGGKLTLERSPAGGLRAILSLPAARD